MKLSEYKSYDELPLFLNATMVAKVLGVSPASSYELMHEAGFPVLKVGNRMGVFEDRISKLLYKLTVEMDMGMSAVLDCVQMDDGHLRKLRSDSVRNVKDTNRLLTLEQKVRAREDNSTGDDQWQD